MNACRRRILGGHFARDAANDKVQKAAGQLLVRIDLGLGDAVLELALLDHPILGRLLVRRANALFLALFAFEVCA